MRRSVIKFGGIFIDKGFDEVVIPSIWKEQTFTEKAGPELSKQMYNFPDKKGRAICLIPEVTGVIQEEWNRAWKFEEKKPCKIFYIQRCYRYERPQKGRYREFTQAGVEILGGNLEETSELAMSTLQECLNQFDIDYEFKSIVQRGLNYYVDSGFEAEVSTLGAQKQIAGGGRYKEGIGWAIGVDRLLLSLS